MVEVSTISGEASAGALTAAKKKRNLPGMPDPEAEVVALSPKTLMATNRFVCEICNKGFQRDQNLQLHRRGHNLPWKLRQRIPGTEPRKRVFVCPEAGCVHHDPKRALGDLTGIKKHFCRKHGEKKWKCERCAKKYAVQSDWKAHMKTCGTREYRCDCGTMFSRRDSFITHRAFCDTLAQETARAQTLSVINQEGAQSVQMVIPLSSSSPPPPPLTPSTAVLSPVLSIQSSEAAEHVAGPIQPPPPLAIANISTTIASGSSTSTANNSPHFATIFTPPSQSISMLCSMSNPECNLLEPPPMSLSLSSSLYLSAPSSAASSSLYDQARHYNPPPALSATALLQKAAQMGATGSSSSFLRGLGLDINLSSTPYQGGQNDNNSNTKGVNVKHESTSSMGPTLDFLGLGIGSASNASFSALLDSISGGLDADMFNSNEDSS